MIFKAVKSIHLSCPENCMMRKGPEAYQGVCHTPYLTTLHKDTNTLVFTGAVKVGDKYSCLFCKAIPEVSLLGSEKERNEFNEKNIIEYYLGDILFDPERIKRQIMDSEGWCLGMK